MKEEQDKWIEGFRNRMKDYSEPAPDQLWEQLSTELERPKVVPFYARWRMVAAVLVLLVASSLTVWFMNSPSADYTKEVSEQISLITEKNVPANRELDRITEQVVPSQPSLPASKQIARLAALPQKTVEEAITESLQRKETEEHKEEGNIVNKEIQKESPEEIHKEKEVKGLGNPDTRTNVPTRRNARSGYSFTASPSTHTGKSWEVGVSVGNVPASVSNTSPGYKSLPRPKTSSSFMLSDAPSSQYPPSDMSGDYNHVMSPVNGNSEVYVLNQILSRNVQNTVVSDIKYRMPITVGASVRLHIDERWAFETGLTYTLLSSDIRAGGNSDYYETEQQLHYVGIPVKMSYNVWENNRFSFYVSAGGAVEKCVSGKAKTVYTTGDEKNMSSSESLKVNPLQWSLSSAVGAQFKLSKMMGIYAEPGVAYYFKDGSEVQTIRKEHPFNFNIQLGIRLSY